MKVLKFVRNAGKSPSRPRSKSPQISPQKPIKLQTVIDSQMLTDMVLNEAQLTAPKENQTLIHILNTLDILMDRITPKPTPEVAQKTYHDLLQKENRRTYDSISRIQSQIEDLQAG